MVKIELAPEEAEELRFILDSYLSDLRMEISQTDSREFRENLKRREVFVKQLLRQLEGTGGLSQAVSG
ncbi:MAG TPA: hypothetical protein VGJ87_14985 [Roseiflexaceae bacterium]|jgi:hypothetical protein